MPAAVEKRGGMRRPIKKKPVKKAILDKNPLLALPKKLTEYKYLFSTTFAPDELMTFTLFTAWVNKNEKTFDNHTQFPIYGIIVNNEQEKEKALNFISFFAKMFEWDDPTLDIYKKYISCRNRIWIREKDTIKLDIKPDNLIYFNMANIPISFKESKGIPLEIGGDNSIIRFSGEEERYLTLTQHPKFFELFDIDDNEVEADFLINYLSENMFEYNDSNETENNKDLYEKNDGNVILLKNQHLLLGFLNSDLYSYQKDSQLVTMEIKDVPKFDILLDNFLDKFLFSLYD